MNVGNHKMISQDISDLGRVKIKILDLQVVVDWAIQKINELNKHISAIDMHIQELSRRLSKLEEIRVVEQ